MAINNKMTIVMFLAILMVVAPHVTQALTCGDVVNSLVPCLGYLKNGVGPSAACCNGGRSLYNAANTTPVRRVACACIKQVAQTYRVNYGYANALPSKCGVHVNYKLSPSLDCSKIN